MAKENTINSILKKELEMIKPLVQEATILKQETSQLLSKLNSTIKKKKIKAQVFIGGSYAKNTLIKKNKYDIDIFIRFDSSLAEEKISKLIGQIVPSQAERVHGSRDYFVLKSKLKEIKLEFEIIPVVSIKKPSQARNITDLSYFHVNYVNRKIKAKPNLASQIMLAKAFIHYQDCYGAESYIHGFSGYAVELLIIHYKTLENFLRAITKTSEDKLILDTEKFYKNKQEILLSLNESKLASPIILVDPTYKERNALAALSMETFLKFRSSAEKFLKNPNPSFFVSKDKEKDFLKKNKNSIIIEVKTNRQPGDIAGTKLRKFYNFFIKEASKYLDIKASDFDYFEKSNVAKIFISSRVKKQIFYQGPPIIMKEALSKFKKEHKQVKIKAGKAQAYEKGCSDFKDFLSIFQNKNSDIIESMGVSEIVL